MNYSTREASTNAAAEALLSTVPRAMRQIRAIARSEAGGLTVPVFRALRYLERHPGESLTALSDHLGVTLPAASALVDRLVGAGLVTRTPDPAERRRVAIVLTAEGRTRVDASTAAVRAWWLDRLAGLTDAELHTLLRALDLVDGVLAAPDLSQQKDDVA
jgi:DNA-binding MarR family transcriptional regulator